MDLDDPLMENEGMEITSSSEPELLLPPSTGVDEGAWDNIFELPSPDRDTPPAQPINGELGDVFEPPTLNLDVEPYKESLDELWELIDELHMEE